MAFRGRIPMFAAASALLALIALLATLQYNWLGRISDAERERMKAMLNARAAAFAQDVDRELTRAFLTFQTEFMQPEDSIAARVALRYDRWQATARYPRMIKDVYLVTADRAPRVMHFNATTRFIEPVEWPAALKDLQAEFGRAQQVDGDRATMIVRTLPPAVIDSIPAVVVPTPILMLSARPGADAFLEGPAVAGTVLLLDREYIVNELVPALARQHFRGAGEGVDYQLAVVRPATNALVYHSDQRFAPTASARVDTSVDLFQVRLQDFKDLVSEVRRLSTFMAMPRPQRSSRGAGTPAADPRLRGQGTIFRHTFTAPIGPGTLSQQEGAPVSIVVEERGSPPLPDKLALAAGAAASRVAPPPAPAWRLMVKHPSGSLAQAVGAVRRRNLILSSSILAILGISVGFLIITTRRAQDLARQQMEFVATVSHELRTPLAVIRYQQTILPTA